MVKILMKTTIAGPNISVSAGQTVSLPPDQAKTLITGGYAIAVVERPVVASQVVETATAEKREKAVKPPVRKRKR